MPKIKDLPPSSRPREKGFSLGVEKLDDVELLALLIGSGINGYSALEIAADLLAEYQGLTGLANAPWLSLAQIKGLSDVKALCLEACFELGRRAKSEIDAKNLASDDPYFVFAKYKNALGKDGKESFIVLLFNKRRRLIKEKTMYLGTSEMVPCSSREILAEALVNNASSLMVVHNHPSGSASPSHQDIEVTSELYRCCLGLGVKLLDHVIVTKETYFSFKENKLL